MTEDRDPPAPPPAHQSTDEESPAASVGPHSPAIDDVRLTETETVPPGIIQARERIGNYEEEPRPGEPESSA